MANQYFRFKQFVVWHHKCAMKVGTDGVLLGASTNVENAESILDIGTGTGLIALMLAQKTSATIDAIDIDSDACIQASENVKNSPWPDKINVIHSGLQEYIENCNKKYDLIVSNPPFFNNSLKASDHQRTLARHTDTLPYQTIIEGTARLLSDTGNFYIILPYIEAQLFIVDAALGHLYCNQKLNIRTGPDKRITRVIASFSKKRVSINESILTIMDIKKEYTKEYKELTKDYYLNF